MCFNVKKLILVTFEHGTLYILSEIYSKKKELQKILILFKRLTVGNGIDVIILNLLGCTVG